VAQVRQSLGPPYAVVVLQSTAEFADLMGPPLQDELDPAEQEYVAGELYPAFERLLKEGFGVAAALPAPSWGPAVHRWEAATTNIEQLERPPSQQAFPEARVAFAGDWLSPEEGETYACVETALGSGLAAAEQILRAEAEEAEASGRVAPKL